MLKSGLTTGLACWGLMSLCATFSAWAWGSNTPADADDKLKKIVGSDAYLELQTYRSQFQTVKTQDNWFKALQSARNLSPKLSPPLSQLHQAAWNKPLSKPLDFNWVEPLTPGLKPRLVAEGTELILALHYPTFAKLAGLTPEKTDDQLMALLQKAWGEYSTDWPRWFAQTWDYGGCTHLGSGLHLQLWQEQSRLQQWAPIFATELKALRSDLFADILATRSFCRPQNQVLSELNQFLKAPGLSSLEIQSLKKRVEALRSGKNMEFDCLQAMGKCDFGA
jgi:hypothetical protein